MKILLVRLSSMGDVLHTLPALTDLRQARPDLCLHWLIEPAFAPVALLHPGVARVIPFALRNYKKQWRGLAVALRDLRRDIGGSVTITFSTPRDCIKVRCWAVWRCAPVGSGRRQRSRTGRHSALPSLLSRVLGAVCR